MPDLQVLVVRAARSRATRRKAAGGYSELFGVQGRRQAGARAYFDCGPATLQVVDVSAMRPPQPMPKALYFTVEVLAAVHTRASALGPINFASSKLGRFIRVDVAFAKSSLRPVTHDDASEPSRLMAPVGFVVTHGRRKYGDIPLQVPELDELIETAALIAEQKNELRELRLGLGYALATPEVSLQRILGETVASEEILRKIGRRIYEVNFPNQSYDPVNEAVEIVFI